MPDSRNAQLYFVFYYGFEVGGRAVAHLGCH